MFNIISNRLRRALGAMALTLLPAVVQADLPVTYKDGSRALFSVSAPRVWVGFVAPEGVRNFDLAADNLRDIGPFPVRTIAATPEPATSPPSCCAAA